MKLAAYLKQAGKTRSAFAAELGTSRQNVARWCDGVTPRREDMLLILGATGGQVTAHDFLLTGRTKARPLQNEGKAA